MPVDYSRTARIYPWMERLVFGNNLQRARITYLEMLRELSRATPTSYSSAMATDVF